MAEVLILPKGRAGYPSMFSEGKKAAHHRSRERLAGFERSAPLLERTALEDRISVVNAVASGSPLSEKNEVPVTGHHSCITLTTEIM